ncbi:MAG TPA: TonB-dependent receptor [bacterium]|nr:TonB-dependent receptor [bacterium]
MLARLFRSVPARVAGWRVIPQVLVLTLISASPGRAQEPPPAPPTFELPEIEVAGKRPQLPTTTPASISVITANEIAAMGALSVADALRVLPEVRIKNSGGPGSLTTVSVRGSSSTQVLILLDGVPINRPDQASVDLSTLPIQNVDHIEVLRGPFSAIYGSAALGGVINIVTKSTPETVLSSRAGSYGLTANLLSLGGQVAGLTYLVQGILNSGAGFVPDTDFSDFTTMAKLRWSTADDAGVTLTLNRFSHNVGTPGPLPAAFQDLLARTLEGRTLVDLSWRRGRADGPGAMLRLYFLDDDVNFNSPGFAFQSDDTASLWGLQGQVVTVPGAGHLLTVGAEYQGQSIAHTDNTPTLFTNTGSDLGLYVQDDWQVSPGVLLSFGVRDDFYQSYGNQVDPRIGVVVLLTDRLALRAGVGRTFRAPSFDELAPAFSGNPGLQPETAWSYDLGVEYTLVQGLALHLTGYYTDATNLITSSPPLFVPMNVGHAIVDGASIELVGRLADRWFVRLNFTDQLARDANTGLDVIYIPRQQANVELTYQWARGNTVTALLSYVGDRFADPANTSKVPGYWLTGITASWALDNGYTLQVGVENLFDVQYQESLGFPEPGRSVFLGLSKNF